MGRLFYPLRSVVVECTITTFIYLREECYLLTVWIDSRVVTCWIWMRPPSGEDCDLLECGFHWCLLMTARECGAIVNPSSTVWLQSLSLFKSCDHLVKDVSLWWLCSVSYESSCEDTHYFHIEEVATNLSLKAATSIAWRAIVEDLSVVLLCWRVSVVSATAWRPAWSYLRSLCEGMKINAMREWCLHGVVCVKAHWMIYAGEYYCCNWSVGDCGALRLRLR